MILPAGYQPSEVDIRNNRSREHATDITAQR
jgi:hypothetical protein